jgi:hypothetical protein
MKTIKPIILIALTLSIVLLANTAGATTIDETIHDTSREQFLELVLATAAACTNSPQ